jgi:hypothetical protein
MSDPKIFFKADKKRRHLALRVPNSIEWKDDELFAMTIIRPFFRTPGDAKPIRVEWGPGLDIANLRNTDQYNITAMMYACRVSKLVRWFDKVSIASYEHTTSEYTRDQYDDEATTDAVVARVPTHHRPTGSSTLVVG